jgi:hypothetical protein
MRGHAWSSVIAGALLGHRDLDIACPSSTAPSTAPMRRPNLVRVIAIALRPILSEILTKNR